MDVGNDEVLTPLLLAPFIAGGLIVSRILAKMKP
jgi:hypothetical protein